MANQPAYKIPGMDNKTKAPSQQTPGMGSGYRPSLTPYQGGQATNPQKFQRVELQPRDVAGGAGGGAPTSPDTYRNVPSPGLGAVVGGDAFTPNYTEQTPGTEYSNEVATQNFDQFMQNLNSLMGNLNASQANYEQMKQEALGNLEYQYGNQLASLSDALAASGMGQSGLALTGGSALGAQSLAAMNQAMTGIQQQQYDDLLKRTQMEGELSLGALNALLGNTQLQDQLKTSAMERELTPGTQLFNMFTTLAESGVSNEELWNYLLGFAPEQYQTDTGSYQILPLLQMIMSGQNTNSDLPGYDSTVFSARQGG